MAPPAVAGVHVGAADVVLELEEAVVDVEDDWLDKVDEADEADEVGEVVDVAKVVDELALGIFDMDARFEFKGIEADGVDATAVAKPELLAPVADVGVLLTVCVTITVI